MTMGNIPQTALCAHRGARPGEPCQRCASQPGEKALAERRARMDAGARALPLPPVRLPPYGAVLVHRSAPVDDDADAPALAAAAPSGFALRAAERAAQREARLAQRAEHKAGEHARRSAAASARWAAWRAARTTAAPAQGSGS